MDLGPVDVIQPDLNEAVRTLDKAAGQPKLSGMPYYAYILRRANGTFYYGSTGDLHARLRAHHRGRVRSTSPYRPLALVWFEEHETEEAARRREFSLKNGRTRRSTINALINAFPSDRLLTYQDA